MTPPNMTVDPRTRKRPIEETHRLAKDFIDQYFESTRRLEMNTNNKPNQSLTMLDI